MTPPRRIIPGSFFYVTTRCVNRSFRLVPREEVCKALHYCLAYVSGKYRSAGQIELYEFVFMSNHYHLLGRDTGGVLPKFVCELNSLISRQLNAIRGIGGRNFDDGYGMQVVLGDERILDHAVYTQTNPVAAFLVTHARKWKGVGSANMEYGEPVVVQRPCNGLWSGKAVHANRSASMRSKRARYAHRTKLPEEALLTLDRPPIHNEMSDTELRTEIRRRVVQRERNIEQERHRTGRRVVGMRAVKRRSFLELPGRGEEMFATRPKYSASHPSLRVVLAAVHRAFLDAYATAREAFRMVHRDVVFPEGTWLLRCRYRVRCEPLEIM